MGFMGFGMQKWIYTMRPRKPFSMERKPSFTVVPIHKRKFKLQHSKKSNTSYIGVVLLIIMLILIGTYLPKIVTYESQRHKNELAMQIARDNYIFNFLIDSGEKRLDRGEISGAYLEFKLAYAIKPDDEKLNKLLLETLEVLCLDYSRYCENYNKLLEKLN